ncbi:MAG: TolC family protein [Muribaculaceae bacterium]|nr:TolC family protein [Muribaculaceae bacterium]
MKIRILTLLIGCNACLSVAALDLSLKECRELALQNDEDMHIAQNRVAQADLDKGIAKTGYLPKFDINGGAFYLTPNPSMGSTMDIQMRGVYMAGISLMQPVYTGGKIITGNKLASIGSEVSRYQLDATRMDIIADAEKSYWMYVAVLSKIDMINSYILQLDSIYSYTKTAYELGLTTRLSLERVESRRSELDYRLRQAQSGADICRMALCRIIGVDEFTPIVPTESLDNMSHSENSFAGIDNRPELLMSQKNIDVKKLDVKMVLSDFLPLVGLQLGWNAFGNMKMTSYTPLQDGTMYPFSQTIDYRGFVGAVSVSIPVFHWGEGYRKVKKAKIEVENATLSFERNRKLMELQARQAYSNYIDGYDLIVTATKALDEAQNNLTSITDQYRSGLMTLTDLLEAQAQWQTSYANLIEAKTQYKINEVDYLRNVGLLE